MEPISSLAGAIFGWFAPGPIGIVQGAYTLSGFLHQRKLNNSIASNNILLEDMLFPDSHPGSVESVLSKCESYVAETLGSEELYSVASQQIRPKLIGISNSIVEEPQKGCSKQQTNEFRKNQEDAKTLLVRYLRTTEQALVSIQSGQLAAEELRIINRFIAVLGSAYKLREQGEEDVHNYIRQFETQNPNSDFCKQIKETRLQLQKRTITLDEKLYLANLKERLEQHPPIFKPGEHFNAKYLGAQKCWRVWLKSNTVAGYSSQGPITIESRPMTGAELRMEDLQKQLERNRHNKSYQALCLVVHEATEQELKIVSEFPANDCFTPFIYETISKKLTYSAESRSAEIFSHYFDPAKKPLAIKEIIGLYADTPHIAMLMMGLPAREATKVIAANPTIQSKPMHVAQREVLYA